MASVGVAFRSLACRSSLFRRNAVALNVNFHTQASDTPKTSNVFARTSAGVLSPAASARHNLSPCVSQYAYSRVVVTDLVVVEEDDGG